MNHPRTGLVALITANFTAKSYSALASRRLNIVSPRGTKTDGRLLHSSAFLHGRPKKPSLDDPSSTNTKPSSPPATKTGQTSKFKSKSTTTTTTAAPNMSTSNEKKHARSDSQEKRLRHPSPKRAKEIDGPENPYVALRQHMAESEAHSDKTKPRNVLYWFRTRDLRVEDNTALHAASRAVQEAGDRGAMLLSCYVVCWEDLERQGGMGSARVDFLQEGLKRLQEQMEAKSLNIPLVPLVVGEKESKGEKIMELAKKWNVSHVFANIEYEVDELRRDLNLFERIEKEEEDEGRLCFRLFHDQTVVEPGKLVTGSGGPHKVFTPYHKAWLADVSNDPGLLDVSGVPQGNDGATIKKQKAGDLFGQSIPEIPKALQFSDEKERDRIRKLWPSGHEAAVARLKNFLEEQVETYAQNRSKPAADNSSRLSPYFSMGMLSAREALQIAKKQSNDDSADFSASASSAGLASWVREIVFREFYRHTLIGKPHTSMNLPSNLKFDFVRWEDGPDGDDPAAAEEGWRRWCEGRTGVPFVDAGMRQLACEAYMHNRLRMNTSSYLRTNLLVDYRRGERFFADCLVDWDLANNTNGWEPSYTVFNAVSQAERCDPEGEYIRKWVPELREVKGKAVFDPARRLGEAEFEKLGYPRPLVDYAESKKRCIERYKSDMAEADV